MKCKHTKTYPEYTHVVCQECGSIKTDSGREWGVGKNTWFKSLDHAYFYAKHGRLPEPINQ